MAGKVPKTRVQLDMTAPQVERLEHLKARLEETSYAGVVRKALNVLGVIDEEQSAGGHIYVERPDGSRTRLVFVL